VEGSLSSLSRRLGSYESRADRFGKGSYTAAAIPVRVCGAPGLIRLHALPRDLPWNPTGSHSRQPVCRAQCGKSVENRYAN
jgi:hypothetical protein